MYILQKKEGAGVLHLLETSGAILFISLKEGKPQNSTRPDTRRHKNRTQLTHWDRDCRYICPTPFPVVQGTQLSYLSQPPLQSGGIMGLGSGQ